MLRANQEVCLQPVSFIFIGLYLLPTRGSCPVWLHFSITVWSDSYLFLYLFLVLGICEATKNVGLRPLRSVKTGTSAYNTPSATVLTATHVSLHEEMFPLHIEFCIRCTFLLRKNKWHLLCELQCVIQHSPTLISTLLITAPYTLHTKWCNVL